MAMLKYCFFLTVIEGQLEELWFHQESATFYAVNETMDLLQEQFGDKVCRNDRANYPPRSCVMITWLLPMGLCESQR